LDVFRRNFSWNMP